MVALMGDAELDEGNIYEAMEGSTTCAIAGGSSTTTGDSTRPPPTAWASAFRDIRRLRVESAHAQIRAPQEAAFAECGGSALRDWIAAAPNDLYAALSYHGGAAWRARLTADLADDTDALRVVAARDGAALAALMTNLAGHDLGLLLDTFRGTTSEAPQLFVIYTVKGFGLLPGHKDNHCQMTNAQMEAFQLRMGVAPGEEWARFAGLPHEAAATRRSWPAPPAAPRPTRAAAVLPVPDRAHFPVPAGKQSTQVAFGKILNDLSRAGGALADAIVTTSPDVTVSTNLGGFVNQRGVFARRPQADTFRDASIASPLKWAKGPSGQHLELGIAEHNLFTMLAAAGLSAELFGERLIPVGTLYDPFINRGLDVLNYACYQGARFLLVATPSGLSLAPEGGAHQSIHTPLIGMAQPGLTYFEPAFADELAEVMRWAFDHLQRPDGGAVYVRLSTRPLDQPERQLDDRQVQDLLAGAYWQVPPGPKADVAIVYTGVVAPEALDAFQQILEDVPDAGLLAVPSPDRLHHEWTAALAARARGIRTFSHVERLLGMLPRQAGLATVIDGPPATLSWLGGVVDIAWRVRRGAFGQSGTCPTCIASTGWTPTRSSMRSPRWSCHSRMYRSTSALARVVESCCATRRSPDPRCRGARPDGALEPFVLDLVALFQKVHRDG
jgi:pyruvate dehydrogenase E1 component